MRTAAVSALCLAVSVSAFKGTAPLLIWGNDETSESVKNVQSVLPSGPAQAVEVYGQLRRLGCDWKEVVVVHVPELHHSHLPALTLPKADLSIPYLVQPSRSELDASLGEWADVCGAKVFENPSAAEGKGIVHITAFVHDNKLNLPTGADLVILTSDPSTRKPLPAGSVTDARSASAIEKLSSKLARKPKAKRSKYLAPVKRQAIDFGALEDGLQAEIEELQGKLEDLGEEYGLGQTSEGEAETEGAQEQEDAQDGQEDEFLSRPQVIDDDSAYADAQNAGTESGSDEYQQPPYPGEGEGDDNGEGEGEGDGAGDNDDSGRNRTSPVDPNAPLLDRVQLFTTPLLTALLVSFLIFIPVIMLGIKSLADIQVPPRMMEISKGAQMSKEKKDQ